MDQDNAKVISTNEDTGNVAIEVTLKGLGADELGKPNDSDFIAILEYGGYPSTKAKQTEFLNNVVAQKRAELEGNESARLEAYERNVAIVEAEQSEDSDS